MVVHQRCKIWTFALRGTVHASFVHLVLAKVKALSPVQPTVLCCIFDAYALVVQSTKHFTCNGFACSCSCPFCACPCGLKGMGKYNRRLFCFFGAQKQKMHVTYSVHEVQHHFIYPVVLAPVPLCPLCFKGARPKAIMCLLMITEGCASSMQKEGAHNDLAF